MGDRAKRPLNQEAVSAADDELYQKHADDPRPNALYDADGNRTPLDANDPDQSGLRSEWMDSYKANGGQTEATEDGGGSYDQVVLPCGQKARVNPLIFGDPVELDDSAAEFEAQPEPEEAEEEECPDQPEVEDAGDAGGGAPDDDAVKSVKAEGGGSSPDSGDEPEDSESEEDEGEDADADTEQP